MEPAGLEPATSCCQPDALPTELWPQERLSLASNAKSSAQLIPSRWLFRLGESGSTQRSHRSPQARIARTIIRTRAAATRRVAAESPYRPLEAPPVLHWTRSSAEPTVEDQVVALAVCQTGFRTPITKPDRCMQRSRASAIAPFWSVVSMATVVVGGSDNTPRPEERATLTRCTDGREDAGSDACRRRIARFVRALFGGRLVASGLGRRRRRRRRA